MLWKTSLGVASQLVSSGVKHGLCADSVQYSYMIYNAPRWSQVCKDSDEICARYVRSVCVRDALVRVREEDEENDCDRRIGDGKEAEDLVDEGLW